MIGGALERLRRFALRRLGIEQAPAPQPAPLEHGPWRIETPEDLDDAIHDALTARGIRRQVRR